MFSGIHYTVCNTSKPSGAIWLESKALFTITQMYFICGEKTNPQLCEGKVFQVLSNSFNIEQNAPAAEETYLQQ